MQVQAQAPRFEPRWPVALTIVGVVALLALLPGRVRLLPIWGPFLLGIMVLIPLIAVELTKANARWLRVERVVTLLFAVVVGVGNMTNLANLMQKIIEGSTTLSGLQLFASSIAVWVTNVLAFSLVYWQLDRGGPVARLNSAERRPDWLFPHEGQPSDVVPPGWRPVFVDYLYLAYSTATAFSATDALPLTSRAKILMMLDSTISLLIVVVIAARAISLIS
jgi:uncharacterized membrane protein